MKIIDYTPLWELMEEKGISQYRLIQNGIASKTIYNMKRNCYVSTSTIEKLCRICGCTPNDIIKFIPDVQ